MKRFKATGFTEYCPCHDAPTLVSEAKSEFVASTAKFEAPETVEPDLKNSREEWNSAPEAIRRAVRIAVGNADIPWPPTSGHRAYLDMGQRILLIEYKLPDVHKLAFDPRQDSKAQPDLAEQLICRWAIQLLVDLATRLETIPLRAIALNGFTALTNSVVGPDQTALVLSVVAGSQTLLSLDIDKTDSRSTFQMLNGRMTESLLACSPIAALVAPKSRRERW
jgi:hypothetical protein